MDRLQEIHEKIGQIQGGSMQEELPEQVLTCLAITSEDRVLEIGCNIGRNSLVIASIAKSLVCIDSNPDYCVTCSQNIRSKGLSATVLPLAISKLSLMQRENDWVTSELQLPIPNDYRIVNTVRWTIFEELYGPFNALIVDSEGSLYFNLLQETDFLKSFNKIILENDFRCIEQKRYCLREFARNRFRCVVSHGGESGDFYTVWIRD